MRKKYLIIFILFLFIIFVSCKGLSDYDAIIYAKKIVKEKLVSPTSAIFSDEKVIERQGNLCLVALTVDSRNYYNSMIREFFLVVVELTEKGPYGGYRYLPDVGAQRFSQPPSGFEISITKSVNNWDKYPNHF